jgi:flagellar basal-body rod protein FlgB
MGPLYLFGVASQVNQWLTARQSAIAENIANANTPNFKAQDVKPFESVLDSMRLTMTATSPEHMSLGGAPYAKTELRADDSSEVLASGNSVNLEKEMIKAGEVNRSYSLNTNVVKAFHRMLLSSTKG